MALYLNDSLAHRVLDVVRKAGNVALADEIDLLMSPPAGEEAYREAARDKFHREGECEIDEDAYVSPSDDPGAYVMAWVWISDEIAGLDVKAPA